MSAKTREFAYAIVGAGPGGLQLGYYLEQKKRDYVILERGKRPGTFFQTFPRHRKLISINKVYTGIKDHDTNLRWDWNSLLSNEPEFNFKSYSKEYFPAADDLVRYLADFSERYGLRVEYETSITRIRKDGEGFLIQSNTGEIRALRLVVATGRTQTNLPDVSGIEHAESYAEVSVDPDDFRDQRVLIIGKGNSAFETGDNLVGTAAIIHMLSPTPVRLAWRTHYVGDLRAVNNNLLDTYQLKSQNTILDANIERIDRQADGSLKVLFRYTHAHGQTWEVTVDRIIACTGFRFDDSIFDPETCRPELTMDRRYPRVTSSWESQNVPGLFFAGTLMHGRDYKKSFSGFIHGFRYNVECLSRLLERRYEGVPLEPTSLTGAEGLARYIIDRATRNSSLFQQPGFLGDILVLEARDRALLYRDLPVDLAAEDALFRDKTYITLTMEYGKLRDGDDPFNIERVPTDGRVSRFIHPVLRCCRGGARFADYHIPEDLENQWDKPMYTEPFSRFVASVMSEVG
jgi:thioredoxin reductase